MDFKKEKINMFYVKVPIKSEQEGIDLVENHIGGMMWGRNSENNSLEAFPYDGETPATIEEIDNTPVMDLDKILWEEIKDELKKCSNIDPNLTMNDITYSIKCFLKETFR